MSAVSPSPDRPLKSLYLSYFLMYVPPSRFMNHAHGFVIRLSAYLAEITGNSTYTNQAIETAQFMINHFVQNDLVITSITADTCTLLPALVTYQTGTLIEGLSVLANVTGDAKWQQQLVSCFVACHSSEDSNPLKDALHANDGSRLHQLAGF